MIPLGLELIRNCSICKSAVTADYKVPVGSKVNMHLQPRMFVKTEAAPPPDKPVEQTRYAVTIQYDL